MGANWVRYNISVRHGQLSEATRAKLSERLEKLPKYFERLTLVELTVDLEREEATSVELRVNSEHKHDFLATESAAQLMTAVDAAIHKVEQQLRKYKEKVQDHHRGNRHGDVGSAGDAG
jgi:putative sigma-54 modulation protein